jgi:uncharacterized RDD family membrane protein YckC
MNFDAGVTVPRYARFSRRLRAIFLDWVIALVAIFGAVLVAAAVGNNNFSRALGIFIVIALMLYEPVLVSFTGGTLGHTWTNLRVVDDRHGGNVSFAKACVRIVIKSVLGWYSFIVLAATRRNQAIHDLLTRSTVQIRDPAKASPGQYITERSAPAAAHLPSRWRRVAVICGYLLVMIIAVAVTAASLLSPRCLDNDYCSAGERLISLGMALVLLALAALIVARGWKGRLFGARGS